MADIKITNGHLLLEDGDLVIISGVNRIIQQIKVGLYILIGDWVLDRKQGIDYFGGMREYSEILSAQIKRAISTVQGVDAVLKYNFYQDENDIIHVLATVKIGNTEITVNEQFNSAILGVAA